MKNIKSGMRKGFTLVELLFVMAIIAILAGFAIANMQGSKDTAVITSMKNDARNATATEATSLANFQEYDTVATATAGDAHGKVQGDLGHVTFGLSKGNLIQVVNSNCQNGSTGYKITITNDKLADTVSYDSCVDSSIVYTPAP